MLADLKKDLLSYSTKKRAESNAWFFKTGKGQYGEGDQFLGVTVPHARKVAKKYKELSLKDINTLLQSVWHEERLLSLFILVHQFQKADEKTQRELYQFYLKNTKHINNWDLVDSSAHKIVGAYLLDKPPIRKILYTLAKSKDLWEKRIAIIATAMFINNNQFNDTLKIAEILLHDKHDLIHKAVGWMLREVGKKDQPTEETFLKKHYKVMPRTMLRYAIEKFDEKKRKEYMKK
jgi:3-methyladenine DNA glycosylase AlkD